MIFLLVNRYNIPELAKTHTVYAMDLLGFGWSEKALIEYDVLLWRDQVADFVKEVVGKPAVLAGNRCVPPSMNLEGIAMCVTSPQLL